MLRPSPVFGNCGEQEALTLRPADRRHLWGTTQINGLYFAGRARPRQYFGRKAQRAVEAKLCGVVIVHAAKIVVVGVRERLKRRDHVKGAVELDLAVTD